MDVTARFPAQFTRAILPQLIQCQPALIQNIGSGAADMPSPWLAIYAACKAFNKTWSRSLRAELMAQAHDVEVQTIVLASVATRRSQRAESLVYPSPRTLASVTLNKVGSANGIVYVSLLILALV
jgi:short-subunit dehydrogenase